MEQTVFTLLFQPPFWIGVAERWDNQGYSAARAVFGAEPTEPEVYQWVLSCWDRLVFTPATPGTAPQPKSKHPKRAQREARQAVRDPAPGTRAQRAIAQAREAAAKEAKRDRRLKKQAQAQEQFRLRQQKKREKRRGH